MELTINDLKNYIEFFHKKTRLAESASRGDIIRYNLPQNITTRDFVSYSDRGGKIVYYYEDSIENESLSPRDFINMMPEKILGKLYSFIRETPETEPKNAIHSFEVYRKLIKDSVRIKIGLTLKIYEDIYYMTIDRDVRDRYPEILDSQLKGSFPRVVYDIFFFSHNKCRSSKYKYYGKDIHDTVRILESNIYEGISVLEFAKEIPQEILYKIITRTLMVPE